MSSVPEGKTINEVEKSKNPNVDGGYAWLIVFAAFSIQFISEFLKYIKDYY